MVDGKATLDQENADMVGGKATLDQEIVETQLQGELSMWSREVHEPRRNPECSSIAVGT